MKEENRIDLQFSVLYILHFYLTKMKKERK